MQKNTTLTQINKITRGAKNRNFNPEIQNSDYLNKHGEEAKELERAARVERERDGSQRESIGDGLCIWQETEFRLVWCL